MRYVSTRGKAPVLGFEDAMLTGLARDGGLYLPQSWPQMSAPDIEALAGLPYAEAAARVMQPYVGDDIGADEFREITQAAYATFSHKAVAPLVQLDSGRWLLELFHGPTLAFKDVAMQLLARLMDRALERRDRRVTIVGATSGDTGGAAIEAFRGRDSIDIFILHPHGRVSEVQRRQMTTAPEPNVHNIAVEGTFDDCQSIVKSLFNDLALRDRLSLAAVNSINWARIMAQTVYYFTSAVALGSPRRPVSFSVPTGNFGDIFAGYVAQKMGLPVHRLVIATNINDILVRALHSGQYESRDVVATSSPSMDIQISSNFERLIFEACGRDAGHVRALMDEFAASGKFTLSGNIRDYAAGLFDACRADEKQCAETIARVAEESGYVADPHTAVGLFAAAQADSAAPVVTLATAHPAKFPDAVRHACGREPAQPARLRELMTAKERCEVIAADVKAIAAHIESRARAATEATP